MLVVESVPAQPSQNAISVAWYWTSIAKLNEEDLSLSYWLPQCYFELYMDDLVNLCRSRLYKLFQIWLMQQCLLLPTPFLLPVHAGTTGILCKILNLSPLGPSDLCRSPSDQFAQIVIFQNIWDMLRWLPVEGRIQSKILLLGQALSVLYKFLPLDQSSCELSHYFC